VNYQYDKNDILKHTKNGLTILCDFFEISEQDILKKKKFQVRTDDDTASTSFKELNGIWYVNDFGHKQKAQNCFELYQNEKGWSFLETCKYLYTKYVSGTPTPICNKPLLKFSAPTPEELKLQYQFYFHSNISEENLKVIGRYVTQEHCNIYNLKSVSSYWFINKDQTKKVEITATTSYPIFTYDQNEWLKVYEPFAEKGYRFKSFGKKPKDFIFGLDYLKNKVKKEQSKKNSKSNKLKYLFIATGGSDGLNMVSLGYSTVWFNSETEHLSSANFSELKHLAELIFNIPDIDGTGIEQARALGFEYLSIRTVWLPKIMKQFNPKNKDVRDYFKYETKLTKEELIKKIEGLRMNAKPFQFWSSYINKFKQLKYEINNMYLYHFLEHRGFYRYNNSITHKAFIFIHIVGHIVEEVNIEHIHNYCLSFLIEKKTAINLQNMVARTTQFSERSLSHLPIKDINFLSATAQKQYFFFENGTWEVTKNKIQPIISKKNTAYSWKQNILPEIKNKPQEKHFEIFMDTSGNRDIKILHTNNWFLNFLINASRIYWRDELEYAFKNKKKTEQDIYIKRYQFSIEGSNLNELQIFQQKQHLINKLYVYGYLLHSYKNRSRAWCPIVMDHRISMVNDSNGGTGKSVFIGSLNHIKNCKTIDGRQHANKDNKFLLDGIKKAHDIVIFDDVPPFFDLNLIYTLTTDFMVVNNKRGSIDTITFLESPKPVITTNYGIKNANGSTLRRSILSSFSDYYHPKIDDYKEERSIANDFDGKLLFDDFDETQWEIYYNFCAQCVQFYLSTTDKIDPPMDNINKRNLLTIMGQDFFDWFSEIAINFKDSFFVKKEIIALYKKESGRNISSNLFKKRVKAFCEYHNYVFNPETLVNKRQDVIVKRLNPQETKEVFYIQTDMHKKINEEEVYRLNIPH